jgi:hypothetical protein
MRHRFNTACADLCRLFAVVCLLATLIGSRSGVAAGAGLQMGLASTGTPLPAYRAFFHHALYLQSKANTVSVAQASVLLSYWQTHIGLSDSEAARLNMAAATHASAVAAIEQQASAIIRAQHAQFTNGGGAPTQGPQLAQLHQQRDDATNAAILALQKALSASSFAKLDSYVKLNFGSTASTTTGPRPAPLTPAK